MTLIYPGRRTDHPPSAARRRASHHPARRTGGGPVKDGAIVSKTIDGERKQRAAPEALRAYASAFERLRDTLQRAASHATRQHALAVHLQRAAIQAGTLIQRAVDDGCFLDDWMDHEGKPVRRLVTPERLGWKFNSPDEKSSMIWANTIGAWLRRSYPGRVKLDVGRYDWREYKQNSKGEPVGRDGKPLKYIRTEHPDGRIEDKRSGELVRTTADYDERAALDHQFIRATDYTEACGLLAELFRERAEKADTDEWLPAGELRCYATKGTLSKLANAHSDIRQKRTRGRPRVPESKHRKIVDAWNTHRYRTYADCARELGDEYTANDVELAVEREKKRERDARRKSVK